MPAPYLIATLSITKQRWYIKWSQTNPLTGKRERIRETFDLNRIKDLELRRKEADKWIAWVNERLPMGYPFNERLNQAKLIDALERARKIKTASDSRDTRRTYNSMYNIFTQWLIREGMGEILAYSFSGTAANDFMEYCLLERKINNNTYNTYLRVIKVLFNELKAKNIIVDNPFNQVKKRKEKAKKRRAFSDPEKEILANYIHQQDPFLFLCVILQYHCFVRPGECLLLKGRHFNFQYQTITIPGYEGTKNDQDGIITIPDKVIPLIMELGVHQFPTNYFLFGKGGRPHPTRTVGYNNLRNRHKRVLDKLHKEGVLTDVEGLELYSWKDTGALELFRKKVNMLEIMKQLRHKDLNTTQKYCQSLYFINMEIKRESDPLIYL